jgi:hypothetical protein
MAWRRVVVLVTSMLFSVSAYATDWRFYSGDENEMMLYSASDLARDGSNVRVWIQVISMKEFKKFLDKKPPETIQKAVDRVKTGYRPPFAEHFNLDAEQATAIALFEEVADEQAAPVKQRSLEEFDCGGGRFRILQFSSFKPGPEATITVPQPWTYIAPDTVASTLKSWVCTPS